MGATSFVGFILTQLHGALLAYTIRLLPFERAFGISIDPVNTGDPSFLLHQAGDLLVFSLKGYQHRTLTPDTATYHILHKHHLRLSIGFPRREYLFEDRLGISADETGGLIKHFDEKEARAKEFLEAGVLAEAEERWTHTFSDSGITPLSIAHGFHPGYSHYPGRSHSPAFLQAEILRRRCC
jgi:hypothetical protein